MVGMVVRVVVTTMVLVGAQQAAAAEVAVLPVQGTNLSEGDAAAIGALIGGAYAVESGRPVSMPAEMARAIELAGGLAPALTAVGATQYLRISAVQLRTRITIHAALMAPGDLLVHQAELTAASLDDLEPVSRRVARALVQRTTTSSTRDIQTVTEREGQRPNRAFVSRSMGLKTGVTWPRARSIDFNPSMSLQFDARLEGGRWFLEWGAGVLLPAAGGDGGDLGGGFAELGANVYLIDAGVAPYLGAGLRPGVMFTLGDGGMTLGIYGQVGITFLREYRSRFYVEFRVTQNAVPFREQNGSLPGTTGPSRRVYPTEMALQAGIGW